ncbi:MAG: T9SS type A sorting domain-containing protein [Bacteroidota bacterium]|nr:T9SS type A sorting domain-containing protein [Bacteroidota bacterium]
MRKLFIFGLSIISLQLLSQNFDNLTYGTDSTLDIISWNVENFPKNESTSIDYLSQAIEALDADIYAFQEIGDTTEFIDIINDMPQYEYSIGHWYYTSLVIVYKPAIIQNATIHEIYTSSSYWNAFPRSPFLINFTSMEQNYTLINNHLKCCGDGDLDMNNEEDEEYRRYLACNLLMNYVDDNLSSSRVILVGDFNDELNDNVSNNVFQNFIDDSNYRFEDMDIANGDDTNWSYPSWPSHLDHILINNNLFSIANHPASSCEVIKVDDVFSSWWAYDSNLSDHRPIGTKLYLGLGLHSPMNETLTLSIFPNPVHDLLHVLSEYSIQSIQVFDTNGALLIEKKPKGNNASLVFSEFKKGIYIIRIKGENKTTIRQIIKL